MGWLLNGFRDGPKVTPRARGWCAATSRARGGHAATPNGLGVAFWSPQMDFRVARKPPLRLGKRRTATPLGGRWPPASHTPSKGGSHPQNIIFYIFKKKLVFLVFSFF